MTNQDGNDPPKSDFLAAEEIKAILIGRERGEQERIIRWVSESLDLSVKTRAEHPHPGRAVPQHGDQGTPDHADVDTRIRDVRTFVQEKQPKSDIQFTAVVAYYHRFVAPESERKEAIKPEDLQTAARQAQRSVFRTPSVPLNNAVQQGYLDRAARGEFRLNAVGENLVAMTLPGVGAEGNSSPGRRRGPSKKATTRKKRTP